MAKSYLAQIDKTIPDTLCDRIDEITDVHIYEQGLMDFVKPHAEYHTKYSPVYSCDGSRHTELLTKILHTYEELPTEGCPI